MGFVCTQGYGWRGVGSLDFGAFSFGQYPCSGCTTGLGFWVILGYSGQVEGLGVGRVMAVWRLVTGLVMKDMVIWFCRRGSSNEADSRHARLFTF